MIKFIFLGLTFLCLFNVAAHADAVDKTQKKQRTELGMGVGALIGGLLAGPPGAIIGAAGGSIFGHQQDQRAQQVDSLRARLSSRQSELADLQHQFAQLKGQFSADLQQVKLQEHTSALQQLAQGVSLVVLFETGSAQLAATARQSVARLAVYLNGFPEIQIHLEGHADRRGSREFNQQLSISRANSVRDLLLGAGIDARRIHSHGYGEARATAPADQRERMMFDRRVEIQLRLDTEA